MAASQGSRCLCKSSDECLGTEEKRWKTKAGCIDAMNPGVPQLEENFRPAGPTAAVDWDEVGQGCTGHSERNSSATTSAIHQMEHSLPLLSFWTSAGMVLNGSWQESNTEIVKYRRGTGAVLTQVLFMGSRGHGCYGQVPHVRLTRRALISRLPMFTSTTSAPKAVGSRLTLCWPVFLALAVGQPWLNVLVCPQLAAASDGSAACGATDNCLFAWRLRFRLTTRCSA